MTILKLHLLVFFVSMGAFSPDSRTPFVLAEDLSYASNLIGSFMDEMNTYSQDYDWNIRIHIEDHLLDPETNVAWDIPGTGFNEPAILARTYLREIKELKIKITYSNYELINCRTEYGTLLGAIVDKTITLPNGDHHDFKEFIELSGNASNIKIISITSSRYQSLSGFNCVTPTKRPVVAKEEEMKEECHLFAEAEVAYQNGRLAEALNLYRKSRTCAENLQYVDSRIAELNTLERRKSVFENAENAYRRAAFQEAIALYEQYLEADTGTDTPSSRQSIIDKIEMAKAEITFREYVEKAEYFMSKRYYEQAIKAYRDALKIKPGNPGVLAQIRKAESNYSIEQTRLIQQQVTRAATLLKDPKTQGDALVTLMKYEDSGLLNAQHFYFMTFVLEQNNKAAKKQFNLSRKDICVLARRYAIKASNLGLPQQDFNYLWETHFNKKSRTCE